MKRMIAIISSFVIILSAVFIDNMVSFAALTDDIARTKIANSSTYYEYDAATKTLKISGSGSVPNFTNSSSGSSAQPWFYWKADGSVERIVVEEGIIGLGDYCFYGVTAYEIDLPDTLVRIGSNSFACNNRLEQIDLHNVTTIMNYAFYSCTQLACITIPSETTNIGISAFDSCTALSDVSFESMSTKVRISNSAFLNCPSLKSVDVPRYASLSAYSLGYRRAVAGAIYEDFSMGVFRDSKAYTYATKYYIDYELLTSMVIHEGDELSCEYFNDQQSMTEKIDYYFTPSADCEYLFCSSGAVDVDCTLRNSNGDIVAVSSDISEDDLNFSISTNLTAGETYCYTVESVYSYGKYTLSFMPVGFQGVSINWNIICSAIYIVDGRLDIASLIEGESVDFIYNSGYVYHMPFEEGGSYLGMELHYVGELDDTVNCGDNVDYITVDDERLAFNVRIIHGYMKEVVEPQKTVGGYTIYTCVNCDDTYISDFTDKLGTDVCGNVKILASPDGDMLEDCVISGVLIYDNEDEFVCETDENGYFYVDSAIDYITLITPMGCERRVYIEKGKGNLGDIAMLFCDHNGDGYINAKDYSKISKIFGMEYDKDNGIFRDLDINKNGIIDYGDWEYAQSFLTYGKLDESIYDN